MKQYFVTLYDEYPIYEPAEGGYYYAGVELTESTEPISSLKEARKILKESAALDDSFKRYWINGFIDKGKYIGESRFLVIEKNQGERVCGWKPYE